MATRRNHTSTSHSHFVDRTIPSATPTLQAQQRSPFLPTRLEALLIAIYPTTLFLGSLFSTLSSTTRSAPYSSALQSHPPESAPSYFAQKKNIFNVYFVKIGWFWTTLALLVFVVTNPTLGPPLWPSLTRRRAQSVLRWALATCVWMFTTQWFFGPPLIDRGFRITGGICEMLIDSDAAETKPLLREGKEILTSAACRFAGGRWNGGYDISGHVFLLILGSALLWLEILPAMSKAEGLRDGRSVQLQNGRVATAASVKDTRDTEGDGDKDVTGYGVNVALGIAALMWWMLLMTAAYFHTWPEKFTGLLVAFGGLYVIYFVPRGVPILRSIVGMPGV
ncbi:hypothetical protein EJ05DRAFT_492910 [Pseudovirgaria hyperparasitica]|uniref:Acyl-coenzyme A diphosphatase SCS3 n=1 Tax=Pseudovirgaria hyperparasitica TaxID=470096 RepID=A0A6A6W7F8_9PEZI|nr:uncharacterized protein EJ05DRAFT_492910 [Pseudovirgaria hyperparasitica]KAF2757816.1 hypothetical protein EJ05DRAFT_492910 [Pseudovirgaria hyperparasitica]